MSTIYHRHIKRVLYDIVYKGLIFMTLKKPNRKHCNHRGQYQSLQVFNCNLLDKFMQNGQRKRYEHRYFMNVPLGIIMCDYCKQISLYFHILILKIKAINLFICTTY